MLQACPTSDIGQIVTECEDRQLLCRKTMLTMLWEYCINIQKIPPFLGQPTDVYDNAFNFAELKRHLTEHDTDHNADD